MHLVGDKIGTMAFRVYSATLVQMIAPKAMIDSALLPCTGIVGEPDLIEKKGKQVRAVNF